MFSVKPPFIRHEGPVAFAHRGGAGMVAPENTMEAFKAAYEMGFRYFETDAHATHDGVLVAFHDDRLERLTDKEGAIGDLMWKDVKAARIAGKYAIPKLEDVLNAWPDAFVNIDPKTDRAASLLPTLLRNPDVLRRVCVGSFNDKRLDMLRHIFGPRLCTSMGPWEVFRLKLLSWHFPIVGFKADCAQVPLKWRGIDIVTPEFLKAAHDSALKVHVWTINDEDEMRRLLDMGVDGIMSDNLEGLKTVMQEKGLWKEPEPITPRQETSPQPQEPQSVL